MRTSPRAIWQLRRRGGVRSTDRPGTKERPAPGESSSSVARCCRARVASGARGPEESDVPRRAGGARLRGTPWSDPPDPPRPCWSETAATGAPELGTQGMVGLTLHVLHAHQPGLEGQLGEPQALLVLAEVLDAEAAEERAQVRLHRRHAEEERRGDVLVGGRARPRVAAGERAAQGD